MPDHTRLSLDPEGRATTRGTTRSRPGQESISTPPILPIRGCLERIRRLMRGDPYIGGGSRQRNLQGCLFRKLFKDAVHGRTQAEKLFHDILRVKDELTDALPSPVGRGWFVFHTKLVTRMPSMRNIESVCLQRVTARPHNVSVLDRLPWLREEEASDGGSSADEGAVPKGTGWLVGTSTPCGNCDGQILASPGRWPV